MSELDEKKLEQVTGGEGGATGDFAQPYLGCPYCRSSSLKRTHSIIGGSGSYTSYHCNKCGKDFTEPIQMI